MIVAVSAPAPPVIEPAVVNATPDISTAPVAADASTVASTDVESSPSSVTSPAPVTVISVAASNDDPVRSISDVAFTVTAVAASAVIATSDAVPVALTVRPVTVAAVPSKLKAAEEPATPSRLAVTEPVEAVVTVIPALALERFNVVIASESIVDVP